jgi:hypothetical protein
MFSLITPAYVASDRKTTGPTNSMGILVGNSGVWGSVGPRTGMPRHVINESGLDSQILHRQDSSKCRAARKDASVAAMRSHLKFVFVSLSYSPYKIVLLITRLYHFWAHFDLELQYCSVLCIFKPAPTSYHGVETVSTVAN